MDNIEMIDIEKHLFKANTSELLEDFNMFCMFKSYITY